MGDDHAAYETIPIPGGGEMNLIHETVLRMIVDGEPAEKVSCTPESIRELAAGWALSEGFIHSSEDIDGIAFDLAEGTCHIRRRPAQAGPEDGWEDRPACTLTREAMEEAGRAFQEDPPLYAATESAHSCMVVRLSDGKDPQILYRSEDAGRNASLDKAIGWAVLHGTELGQCLLMTSGRINMQMVRKAARAGAGALSGLGTVTAEAVRDARESGMVLIGYSGSDREVWFLPETED